MDETYPRRPKRSPATTVLNLLTFLVLLTALCVGGAYAAIFVDPYLPFNPFPPPTFPPTLGFPTPTSTAPVSLPPTWTPTSASAVLTGTPTPEPSVTPTPPSASTGTSTSTPSTPLFTSTPTSTPWPFVLEANSPVYTENFNDQRCNWLGIAGPGFDKDGNPLPGDIVVRLRGQLAGQLVQLDAITGTAPDYGEAGYEFYLSDQPIASENTLSIQLFDTGGIPLSERVFLITFDACDKNLVLVNWNQTQ